MILYWWNFLSFHLPPALTVPLKTKQNFIYGNNWCNSASAAITQLYILCTPSMLGNALSPTVGFLGLSCAGPVAVFQWSLWVKIHDSLQKCAVSPEIKLRTSCIAVMVIRTTYKIIFCSIGKWDRQGKGAVSIQFINNLSSSILLKPRPCHHAPVYFELVTLGNQTNYWSLHQASQCKLWLIAYVSFWEWGNRSAVADERKLCEAAPKVVSSSESSHRGWTLCLGTLVHHLKYEQLLKHSAQSQPKVKKVKLWECL